MNHFKAPAALLDELGITEPSDIVIEAIAQHCGATIVYERLDGCEARILGYGDKAIITINAEASRERQRFSAGHELGHWMRDRGKVTFACTDRNFVQEWGNDNPERRANRYAADVLLPRKLFEKAARARPPTFESARALSALFETSLTSTAIRLVELGDSPSMILCTDSVGRQWFFRSPSIPEALRPLTKPGPGSLAAKLLAGTLARSAGPQAVDADDWIDRADAARYTVIEDSVRTRSGLVLTLLWWKNEAQLVDEEDEDDALPSLTGELTFASRRRRR
ncbi:MAG: ImmA/IrrE family metallo-endopeptidase [Myxococcota bacterium]